MRINNNVDNNYSSLLLAYFLSCLAFSYTTLLIGYNSLSIALFIFLLIVNSFLMYFVYCRSYKFENKYLLIKVGFITKKIKYKEIKKVYITNYSWISYNTSPKCLCIETKNEKLYISPKKMDEALMYLIKNRGGKR